MAELAKLLGDRGDEEELRFNKDENHVYFTAGERDLVSRVLTGQFPNYEMVIPKDQPYSASVNVELFTSALRRVALIADERSRGVKIAFSEGRVELSTRRVDEDEEAREDLMCHYDGEPLEISFNSSYVLGFFDVVKSGEVKIGLKDGQSPALFSPAEGDYSYKYVVMPMRMV
jgi:DNA polymerase-3 subunit beta